MATKNRQSKFYWNLPLFFSVTLVLGLIFSLNVYAQYGSTSSNYYRKSVGKKFFLLTESSFTSEEIARVRLEAPNSGDYEGYSGVDIVVYRILNPIDFLQKQSNFHRPDIPSNYQGEGMHNALGFLWDIWYIKSRTEMRNIFFEESRYIVQKVAPELKHNAGMEYYGETNFQHNSQYGKLPGHKFVMKFRYPIWRAKSIEPSKEAKLSGVRSIQSKAKGNVYIPLGKMNPGLFVVEAIIGTYRATALLFVSDSVAVTKMSGNQTLVWTVLKKNGKPSPETEIMLADGIGKLKTGTTDEDGILKIEKKSPEQSYLIGKDVKGGVFVSDNFYYDSELYASKIYLFSDRPIYQPGESVFIKLIGRKFITSSESTGLEGDTARLSILDPNGTPLIVKKLKIDELTGSDTGFKLPKFALSGGYTIHLNYEKKQYNGFFRVANFSKPHFEVEIITDKKLYKTNEPITGKIKLTYPNGDPVSKGKVTLNARSQMLTVVEGEMRYLGLFPIQLQYETGEVGRNGIMNFELPPVQDPSRYVLRVRASDNTSYRVASVKEILVHEGYTFYTIASENNFGKIGDRIEFTLKPHTIGKADSIIRPASWEIIRLQDQSTQIGKIDQNSKKLSLKFDKAGSYTIYIKGEAGNTLGTKSYFIEGDQYKNTPGSIDVVLDKDKYVIGDEAKALITFSEEIDQALVTLERDNVSKSGLLTEDNDWIEIKKISSRQYAAKIPIADEFSPNITLSFVYVKNGKYIFRNKGIKVAIPEIEIGFQTEKSVYKPGEEVKVNVITKLKSKAISTMVTVSLVDEMIYVLQPEIAPKITDFFYHRRRNQVKTSSSLSFYSFDVAKAATGMTMSSNTNYRERSLKFREGSRREDINTAVWIPTLKTDEDGKASFTFKMPDSVTRWRLTGRAISKSGAVGQKKRYLNTEMKYFIKWTGPTVFRNGDKPNITLIAFNLTNKAVNARIVASGMEAKFEKNLKLQPGSNYFNVVFRADKTGDLKTTLTVDGQITDELATKIRVVPRGWKSVRSSIIEIQETKTVFDRPERSFNVRLGFAQNGPNNFIKVMDNLIEYPYGCVEQTASKLIPLSIAYMNLKETESSRKLKNQLSNWISDNRLRLVQMAGPKARFSWWGDMTHGSPFLTGYAYYADWLATTALGITVPQDHWNKLIESYRRSNDPLFIKALILWQATEIGLPVKSLVQGLLEQYQGRLSSMPGISKFVPQRSYIIEENTSGMNKRIGIALLTVLLKEHGISPSNSFANVAKDTLSSFKNSEYPLAATLYLLSKGDLNEMDRAKSDQILSAISYNMPTIDRALTLAFLNKALGWKDVPVVKDINPGNDWKKVSARLGRESWLYSGPRKEEMEFTAPDSMVGNAHAQVIYDTYSEEESKLPVTIERVLYKLHPGERSYMYQAERIRGKKKVDSQSLYVDEIRITKSNNRKLKYGILEVPLPPGADLENPTYGMYIKSENRKLKLTNTKHVPGDQVYSVPIETLNNGLIIRNLVRFSQKGNFTLPRARLYRMYNPFEKGFEETKSRIIVK